MKKTLLFILLAIMVSNLLGNEIDVESRVTSATVFKNRAMITRNAEITLSKGNHTLVISKLTTDLNDESVRITATGSDEIKILDVKVEKHFEKEEKKPEYANLEEKIDSLKYILNGLKDRQLVLTQKKKFVESLQAAKETDYSNKITSSTSVTDWNNMLGFIDKSLTGINHEIREIEMDRKSISDQISLLERQKYTKAGPTQSFKKIIVELENKKESEVSIIASYLVNNASWYPVYDIRVSSKDKIAKLYYYGMVRQKTGEDWDDINLTLSTAAPLAMKNIPELGTWYIDKYVPVYSYNEKAQDDVMISAQRAPFPEEDEQIVITAQAAGHLQSIPVNGVKAVVRGIEPQKEQPKSKNKPNYTNIKQTELSTVFDVPTKNNIPSDDINHKVTISISDLPMNYEYTSVPKITEKVFFKGKIYNSNKYPLLYGKINIFVDQDFLNSAYLTNTASLDTFELALGIDDNITIEREFINKYTESKGLIKGSNKITYEYKITLSNHRETEEKVEILDQLPISMNESIKVELLEPEIKDKDLPSDGTLKWIKNLQPKEEIEIPIKFTVEYPKNMKVEGLE